MVAVTDNGDVAGQAELPSHGSDSSIFPEQRAAGRVIVDLVVAAAFSMRMRCDVAAVPAEVQTCNPLPIRLR